jgi:hypothetical protein
MHYSTKVDVEGIKQKAKAQRIRAEKKRTSSLRDARINNFLALAFCLLLLNLFL